MKVSCHSQMQREEKTVSLISAVPRTLESDSPLLEERRKGKSKTKVTETTISATVLKTH